MGVLPAALPLALNEGPALSRAACRLEPRRCSTLPRSEQWHTSPPSSNQHNSLWTTRFSRLPRTISRHVATTASHSTSSSSTVTEASEVFKEQLWSHVLAVRGSSPLVQNITNYVVMNTSANAVLSVGGSPIMSYAPAEIKDLSLICQSLVVNIGTLDDAKVASMLDAADAYNAAQKPWVLDPVGAGATRYRTEVSRQVLEKRPALVRGNAGEVMALAEVIGTAVKGVDSLASTVEDATKAGEVLFEKYGSVVSISGETDIIMGLDKGGRRKTVFLSNGDSMMTRVTGLGCSLSAVSGAFAGAIKNQLEAAVAAAALFGVAGELAAQQAHGPGSLQMLLLDKLYNLTLDEFMTNFRASIMHD